MTHQKSVTDWILLVILLGGCAAGRPAFDNGQALIRAGKTEEGLAALEQALKENPKSGEYKVYYLRQKEQYMNFLLAKADAARAAKRYAEAETGYRQALKYGAHHARASAALSSLRQAIRHDEMSAGAVELLKLDKLEEAQLLLRTVLQENPQHEEARQLMRELESKIASQKRASEGLGAVFRKAISLEFREASIQAIFEVMSRFTQLNFIFDRDVREDLKVSLSVKNTSIESVIDQLLKTNQLDKRVLNENTLLIYPSTPAKVKDYQELVVRAFNLANADVKQTLNLIKTLVNTRDIFMDEKLNLLVIRDTPEAIRLAEKVIATQDRTEAEVVLEITLMEVNRSRLLDLGIQWPNQFTALNIASQATSSTNEGVVVTTTTQAQNVVTLDTLRNLSGAQIAIAPNVQFNLKKEDGDAQILANPRIRVKNKEKAKIHIGEKVPVITTTSTANVGVSESVTYLDVGLKLDVEPDILLDNDLRIKVGLEVSSIVREIRSQSGALTYQVGTRNASTVLRLRDGEAQVMAGLIGDEDRRVASKIPGLGDLPLLGHLFSTNRDETSRTEIVLLITPHIVRNLMRPRLKDSEFFARPEAVPLADAGLGQDVVEPSPGLLTPKPSIVAPRRGAAKIPKSRRLKSSGLESGSASGSNSTAQPTEEVYASPD